eukprot:39570_1
MRALLRRVVANVVLQTVPCRSFSKSRGEKKDNIESVTKSIKSKFAKEKMQTDLSSYTYKTRQKIQNPSGYQHVKTQLRRCNHVNEVMKIMQNHKKCEDVHVGTTAIKAIKILFEKGHVPGLVAMKHIDEIWKMMSEYVVGMDSAAYNEYFHACALMRFDRKCPVKFEEMIEHKIVPGQITLNILLQTCRYNGNIKTALKYWNTILTCVDEDLNADSWAGFLAVCASAENINVAEEFFVKCPYKANIGVCYRMMSVYKNCYNIEKMLEMRDFMLQQNIEMDVRIYNTMIHAYRNDKQWQQAINIAEEAISVNKRDKVTIHHLLESNIGLLKITDDLRCRKAMLQYIESDVVKYFAAIGAQNTFQDSRYGNRMLAAYIYTFREGFGFRTFEECCGKYNVQYWENIEQLQIPTVNLFMTDYLVAKAILEYIFEKQLHVFRDLGLNIIISRDDRYKYRFEKVSEKDVNEILSALPTPMKVIQKDPYLLYISCEQTKCYEHEITEPMFGDD